MTRRHACDQSDQQEPQTPRHDRWASSSSSSHSLRHTDLQINHHHHHHHHCQEDDDEDVTDMHFKCLRRAQDTHSFIPFSLEQQTEPSSSSSSVHVHTESLHRCLSQRLALETLLKFKSGLNKRVLCERPLQLLVCVCVEDHG